MIASLSRSILFSPLRANRVRTHCSKQLILDRNSILVDNDHIFFRPDVFGEFDKFCAIWSWCQMMFTQLCPMASNKQGELFGRKRHVIIEIEIASVGGDPPEAPAHALLVSVDLSKRSARNGRERHIAM